MICHQFRWSIWTHSDGLPPGRPPGSKHPWGPRSGWYRSRPGAGRRGEYPNGSNIKNMSLCDDYAPISLVHLTHSDGLPQDDPACSKHLWGLRLGWYRFRPGAGRRGEYPNGSNIKIMSFVMICTNFVGPFDPFRRPAPGRPPGFKAPMGT